MGVEEEGYGGVWEQSRGYGGMIMGARWGKVGRMGPSDSLYHFDHAYRLILAGTVGACFELVLGDILDIVGWEPATVVMAIAIPPA